MKTIVNFITSFLKIILSIINFILIVIIVLNVLILLSSSVAKSSYPTILDYTYYNVFINDQENNLNKGSLLLIDSRKAYETGNIVMFYDNKNLSAGKIADINNDLITIKSHKKEFIKNKSDIIGPMIFNIPQIGSLIDIALKPISLIISIIILIITSILQNLLIKKSGKKQEKPNFKQMKNI